MKNNIDITKLSIVTVTFNNFSTIEQTIKSVLDQEYSNLEYIIIDGGSTDGTLNILDKYKTYFKYFKSSPDKGIYDAMNKGISKATGDLIGFVNGDDFLYKNVLKKVNKLFLKKKTNFFFTIADIDYVDKNNNIVGSKICRPINQILRRKFLEMPSNHLGLFVPLKAFDSTGFFDLNFPNRADYLFVLRLIKIGYMPINIEIKAGCFRLGGQSGGYKTFLENYKIITLMGESKLLAFYSSLLGISKLFLRRNLSYVYKFIVYLFYKINSNQERREKFENGKKD